MPSRLRHLLFISITVFALFFVQVERGDGSVGIQYIYDEVGNRIEKRPGIDSTVPITTALPAGGIYNTAQSVSLSCDDGTGVGCDKIYYTTDGSAPTTSSPKYTTPINISATTTLKFFAVDLAGNSENPKTQIYTIETTPPTGAIIINEGAANTNSISVTLTLTCNDSSSCSQMQFSNDNVAYSTPETYSAMKAWTLTTGDGTKTVYAKFRDGAGNWSAASSDSILLDTLVQPGEVRINGGASSTNNINVTLTLTCSDPSGCSQMQFSNDGASYSSPEVFATTKAWALASGDGLKTVYAKFRDGAGNWSAACNDLILLDTTPPIGTIIINGGAASTNIPGVTLTLTCSDGAGSGCAYMQFSNDGTTYSSPEAYATTKAWTLTSGDGLKTVYVKFGDAAGNWSTAYSDTILLESTVKIGGISYSTIQAAYNVAGNGDVIKCRDLTLVESLTVNRNITVFLEGGYNSDFTSNYGIMTTLRGMITTTAGGGTIKIKNFKLIQ